MKIAICNSNEKQFREMKEAIYLYAENKRIEMIVVKFRDAQEILFSKKSFELIILCCHESDFKACEIAKKIKEVKHESAIVFLSPDTSFVLEAFKVNAFRFLIEPVKKSDLFSVLDDFFESNGNDYFLWFKSHADTFCVNTKEIVFIEAENKHCYINLADDSFRYNRTMAKVFETLPKNHFFKINRSYIVNGDYIRGYNSQSVFLKTGEELRITRSFLPDFVAAYRSYNGYS